MDWKWQTFPSLRLPRANDRSDGDPDTPDDDCANGPHQRAVIAVVRRGAVRQAVTDHAAGERPDKETNPRAPPYVRVHSPTHFDPSQRGGWDERPDGLMIGCEENGIAPHLDKGPGQLPGAQRSRQESHSRA